MNSPFDPGIISIDFLVDMLKLLIPFVAVSCGDRGHTIHLIDFDCLQLTGSIDTSDRTYGITCHGGSLIYLAPSIKRCDNTIS
jgi:hypothetical protein